MGIVGATVRLVDSGRQKTSKQRRITVEGSHGSIERKDLKVNAEKTIHGIHKRRNRYIR